MKNKITIIGAGNVGTAAAQLIAAKGLADIVLLDKVEGLAHGKALDLSQAALVECQDISITRATDWCEMVGSRIIIVIAGIAAKESVNRNQLLKSMPAL